MSTPSGEEVPNSISNSTLQAMLAARQEGGLERPEHVPNEDPSVQALMVEVSAFKRLVKSGATSGSKADAWKKAMAEEAEVVAIRAKAEGGDAEAMSKLGYSYRGGSRGLKKDFTQSFTWFKRAADLKDVDALTSCGVAYLNGKGVERSIGRGLTMLGWAAALGSEHACGLLGQLNAEGRYGYDKDPQEATRLYREMHKCDQRNSNEEVRENAAAWLREHP